MFLEYCISFKFSIQTYFIEIIYYKHGKSLTQTLCIVMLCKTASPKSSSTTTLLISD